jgi:hypothetical protein
VSANLARRPPGQICRHDPKANTLEQVHRTPRISRDVAPTELIAIFGVAAIQITLLRSCRHTTDVSNHCGLKQKVASLRETLGLSGIEGRFWPLKMSKLQKRLAEPLPAVWTFRRATGCLRPELRPLRPRASVRAKSLNGQARMCPSATGETPILHCSVSYQGVDCVVSAVGPGCNLDAAAHDTNSFLLRSGPLRPANPFLRNFGAGVTTPPMGRRSM